MGGCRAAWAHLPLKVKVGRHVQDLDHDRGNADDTLVDGTGQPDDPGGREGEWEGGSEAGKEGGEGRREGGREAGREVGR